MAFARQRELIRTQTIAQRQRRLRQRQFEVEVETAQGDEQSETGEQSEPEEQSEPGPTIFVSIPSYRDEECPKTVIDCLQKAEYPSRVHIGVFEQNDPVEDEALSCSNNVLLRSVDKVKTVPSDCAKGPVYARAVIEQELFADEDYVLCIDSHTLFSPNWDTEAIRQLALADSPKPILTCYPEEYDRKTRALPLMTIPPTYLKLRGFHPRLGFTQLDRGRCLKFPQRPIRSLFWAAGFSFAPGKLVREVPFDPNLQYSFLGEELAMSARFFTHGWDTFSPMTNLVYHYTPRDYRPTFWEQFYKRQGVCKVSRELRDQRRAREHESNERVMDLVTGVPIDPPYGLGTERTMDEFRDFTGVDVPNRKARRNSYLGLNKIPDSHEQLAKQGSV